MYHKLTVDRMTCPWQHPRLPFEIKRTPCCGAQLPFQAMINFVLIASNSIILRSLDFASTTTRRLVTGLMVDREVTIVWSTISLVRLYARANAWAIVSESRSDLTHLLNKVPFSFAWFITIVHDKKSFKMYIANRSDDYGLAGLCTS
jgi:hypothetical protein